MEPQRRVNHEGHEAHEELTRINAKGREFPGLIRTERYLRIFCSAVILLQLIALSYSFQSYFKPSLQLDPHAHAMALPVIFSLNYLFPIGFACNAALLVLTHASGRRFLDVLIIFGASLSLTVGTAWYTFYLFEEIYPGTTGLSGALWWM